MFGAAKEVIVGTNPVIEIASNVYKKLTGQPNNEEIIAHAVKMILIHLNKKYFQDSEKKKNIKKEKFEVSHKFSKFCNALQFDLIQSSEAKQTIYEEFMAYSIYKELCEEFNYNEEDELILNLLRNLDTATFELIKYLLEFRFRFEEIIMPNSKIISSQNSSSPQL